MTNVRSRLPRLESHHDLLWVDRPEGVDHDFAFDGLNRIHDDRHSARVQLFERLQTRSHGSVSTARWRNASDVALTCCVLTSTDDSQQPNPG